MKYNTAVKKLKKLITYYSKSELYRSVAESIIDEADGYESINDWLDDLMSHGCVSGMIGGLIYYKDTYAFFDTHYSDIMDLVNEYNYQGVGVDLMKDGDIKNTGAWFAYEETARQIAQDMGIEL